MFGNVKSWTNWRSHFVKGVARVLPGGKTWTRRVRWLEDGQGNIKLKLEVNDQYREVIVSSEGLASIIWDRFKLDGSSIDDCVSILYQEVPKRMASRRVGEK